VLSIPQYSPLTQVSEEEKERYQVELLAASPNVKADKLKTESFYKVPKCLKRWPPLTFIYIKVKWTRVTELVEKRKVFLKGGLAYVPGLAQSSIVFQEFETNLENALEVW
jgi:DNA primase large subunit